MIDSQEQWFTFNMILDKINVINSRVQSTNNSIGMTWKRFPSASPKRCEENISAMWNFYVN